MRVEALSARVRGSKEARPRAAQGAAAPMAAAVAPHLLAVIADEVRARTWSAGASGGKEKAHPFLLARARQQRAAPVALGWHHAHTRCSGHPHPSNARPRPPVFGGRLAAGNTLLLLLPEGRNQSESSEGAPLGAPPPALLLMCGRRVPARHRVLASQRRRPWSCGDRCARVAALSAPPAPPLTPP